MKMSNKISSPFSKGVHFIVVALIVAVLSTVCAGRVHAEGAVKKTKQPVAIKAAGEKKLAAVSESFRRDFPNVVFSQIEESGIEGLYEVTMGVNIVYYAPAAGRVISGDMFDKNGMNITNEKRQLLMALQDAETAKLIDTLPLDKAIKIGNGKNIVIEFTDIDCPYCRKVEAFFKNRDDITRYIFLFPLVDLHPRSLAKSREVLCSEDPAGAYEAAMDGKLDNADLKGCIDKEKDIDEVLAVYMTTAKTMGVDSTPTMWVNRQKVNGADTRKIEQFLDSEKTGTTVVP